MSSPAPALWGGRLGVGVMAGSFCLLALELALSRIFSVFAGEHFVALSVALALFGITVSGLAVFLAPRRFLGGDATRGIGWSLLALAVALVGLWAFFLMLSRSPQLASRLLSPLHRPQYEPYAGVPIALLDGRQILPLGVLCLVSAIPFVVGGFVATLALSRHRESAAPMYAWNLAGAGLGCLAGTALLTRFDPFTALAALGSLAALAAWLCFRGGPAGPGSRAAPVLATLALALAAGTAHGGLVELKFVLGHYQPNLLLARWNAYSRVAVWPLGPGGTEAGWGGTSDDREGSPEPYALAVDNTAFTTIVRHRPGDDPDWARENLLSLPYALRERARALIVGSGGGREILIALGSGAETVRAVESNPLVVRTVQEDFGDFSGRPYSLPGVTLTVADGRGFIARDTSLYDVIQAAPVSGWLGPASGAFPFTGNHLSTIEAFHAYLDRLEPGGLLTFQHPVREKNLLRLIATVRVALTARGFQDIPGCVFVAAERGLASVIVKSAPFTAAELGVLRLRCRESAFQVLFSPGGEGANRIADLLLEPNIEALLEALPFDAAAVDDDRPFFSHLMRPAAFLRGGAARAPDLESVGLLWLRNLLGAMMILALSLALPLALRGRAGDGRPGRAWAAPGYFAAIGLGFIVVETGLLKHFVLLLGNPATTRAVPLAVFLAAGAAGSARARGLAGSARLLRRHCAILTIVLLFTAVLLPPALAGLLGTALWLRIAVSVAVAAPLGYLLGQPLPAGLSLLGQARILPLAWGLNGAFLVLGSVGALLLAVNVGYTVTMLVGPACYLVAGALSEVVE